jgi:putative PIN family toxin of toxin-antitoxin system
VRIVVDTNLLVSAVISSGLPRRLLDAALASTFELCTSEVLLAELQEVLSREKFASRLLPAQWTPESFVDDLRKVATVVSPAAVPRVVANDADDDHVLAAAVTCGADLIASGDKRHVLPLGSHQGIPIVTARQALHLLDVASKG